MEEGDNLDVFGLNNSADQQEYQNQEYFDSFQFGEEHLIEQNQGQQVEQLNLYHSTQQDFQQQQAINVMDNMGQSYNHDIGDSSNQSNQAQFGGLSQVQTSSQFTIDQGVTRETTQMNNPFYEEGVDSKKTFNVNCDVGEEDEDDDSQYYPFSYSEFLESEKNFKRSKNKNINTHDPEMCDHCRPIHKLPGYLKKSCPFYENNKELYKKIHKHMSNQSKGAQQYDFLKKQRLYYHETLSMIQDIENQQLIDLGRINLYMIEKKIAQMKSGKNQKSDSSLEGQSKGNKKRKSRGQKLEEVEVIHKRVSGIRGGRFSTILIATQFLAILFLFVQSPNLSIPENGNPPMQGRPRLEYDISDQKITTASSDGDFDEKFQFSEGDGTEDQDQDTSQSPILGRDSDDQNNQDSDEQSEDPSPNRKHDPAQQPPPKFQEPIAEVRENAQDRNSEQKIPKSKQEDDSAPNHTRLLKTSDSSIDKIIGFISSTFLSSSNLLKATTSIVLITYILFVN